MNRARRDEPADEKELPEEDSPAGGSEPTAEVSTPVGPGRVHAARLRCENCGRVTDHRIVRWDPRSGGPGRHWSGVARCRACGWTHPFEVVPVARTEVDLIVSRGETSERRRVRLPASGTLTVGSRIPGARPPLEIRKITGRSGETVREAPVAEVGTVWAVPPLELRLAVSVVDGERTRSFRWVVRPDTVVEVGTRFEGEGGAVWVVAVRARGRTWRREGDRFPAREVQRLYGRRTVIPPAGRSDWRSGRAMPRSRQSSTSRSDRSRSSPGVSRTRT